METTTKFGIPSPAFEQMMRRFEDRPEVERVLLYGSRARGDAERRSDIDLAIEAPEATAKQWLDLAFFLREELKTLLAVDVVRWETAPASLREEILREGKVLYDRKTASNEA